MTLSATAASMDAERRARVGPIRVLVAAASKHGSTDEMGRAIGEALVEAGLDVEVRAPDVVDSVEPYDAVVLGSAVYIGRWLEPARRFVERHGEALRARAAWLFSSGPLGNPPHPADDPLEVSALVERTAAQGHRLFPGQLKPDVLSLLEKATVRMVGAPYGDYRPWDEIRAWADEIGRQLRDEGAPR